VDEEETMNSREFALHYLSDDTLAIVAGSLAGGILSSDRNRGISELPAQVAEAQALWLDIFDSLRTLQSQYRTESVAAEWD
jgi:hypothetical protein